MLPINDDKASIPLANKPCRKRENEIVDNIFIPHMKLSGTQSKFGTNPIIYYYRVIEVSPSIAWGFIT